MDVEMKNLVQQLGENVEKLQKANDERIKALETKGAADPLLASQVDKINARVTEIQDSIKALETSAARIAAGGDDRTGKPESKHVAEFMSLTTGKPIDQVVVTKDAVAQYELYSRAFSAYARRGEAGLSSEFRAALQVGSDPSGGWWVPPDQTGRIAQLVYETSPIRQVANVETTSSDRKEGFNDLNEVSSGWVGETAARPETTTADVGKWSIPVMEQYAMPKTTQKELDDAAVNVDAWLNGKIADKFARQENLAFVSGSGVLKPRGFNTYTSGVPSAATWNVIEQVGTGVSGAFAATPNGADVFISTIGKMKAQYLPGAMFGFNRTTEAAARLLKDNQGRYLFAFDFSQGAKPTILGYPTVRMEDLATIGAASLSIVFANFKEAYTIVDRMGIRVLRDPYTAKPNILFYATKRVGGDVTNFEAIKFIRFS